MKKFIAAIILFSVCNRSNILFAQEELNNLGVWNYVFYQENNEKEINRKAGIKAKTVQAGRPIKELKYQYDTAGRLIYYSFNKHHEIRTSYNSMDKKNFVSYYKRGRLIELDSFIWDGPVLKECDAIDEKRKIFERQRYKYDSIYVTEYVKEKLKHGKFKEVNKQVTEYYPDHSYKKITFYKKGKAKYFSVFDCNPAGRNHKVEKDSSYNCVKEDVDSLGNKIKITITNDRDHSWKKVQYFNDKDQNIADKTFDLKRNEELMWAYYYRPGEPGHFKKFISYKHGKEYYRYENTFDDKSRVIETKTSMHGKLKTTGKNVFNERGQLAKSEKYNRHNKLKSASTFTYEYY